MTDMKIQLWFWPEDSLSFFSPTKTQVQYCLCGKNTFAVWINENTYATTSLTTCADPRRIGFLFPPTFATLCPAYVFTQHQLPTYLWSAATGRGRNEIIHS